MAGLPAEELLEGPAPLRAGARQHPIDRQEVINRDDRLLRQRMAAAGRDTIRLLEECLLDKIVDRLGQLERAEHHVDPTAAKLLKQKAIRALDDPDLGARVCAERTIDGGSEQRGRGERLRADEYAQGAVAAKRRDLVEPFLQPPASPLRASRS